MRKFTGPNGEPMTSMRLDELPEISDERLAEIAAMPDIVSSALRGAQSAGGKDEIDTSDIPSLADDDEFWDKATVGFPSPRKVHLSVRLDDDIVHYFKRRGRGYQSRINAVLRSYVHAQLQAEAEERGRRSPLRAAPQAQDAEGTPLLPDTR